LSNRKHDFVRKAYLLYFQALVIICGLGGTAEGEASNSQVSREPSLLENKGSIPSFDKPAYHHQISYCVKAERSKRLGLKSGQACDSRPVGHAAD
jgi:hypothetical protein